MVIKRGISSSNTFEPVIKIENYFCKWHFKSKFNTSWSQITLVNKKSTFVDTKRHNVTDIFRLGNNLCFYKRFFNLLYPAWVGHLRRIVYGYYLSFGSVCDEAYVWNGCN